MSDLCLLDLTAAFDTIDHKLLLNRLERPVGLRGVGLKTGSHRRAYLSGSCFQVYYGGSTSEVFIVCSVP